jgi:hypothetical protein
MTTTASIFRKHNFLILDSILNSGGYLIECKVSTNLHDDIFNKPYSKIIKPKNPKINENSIRNA